MKNNFSVCLWKSKVLLKACCVLAGSYWVSSSSDFPSVVDYHRRKVSCGRGIQQLQAAKVAASRCIYFGGWWCWDHVHMVLFQKCLSFLRFSAIRLSVSDQITGLPRCLRRAVFLRWTLKRGVFWLLNSKESAVTICLLLQFEIQGLRCAGCVALTSPFLENLSSLYHLVLKHAAQPKCHYLSRETQHHSANGRKEIFFFETGIDLPCLVGWVGVSSSG